jgi:hypothetical protein
MKKVFQWIKDNPNRTMFLVPILLVAGISISHVVSWYDIANPINWAIYLSIAIEVGAMTALVAATNRIKGGVWFMFGLVTLIQMIGNIFYSYKEIDSNGELFKAWVELTSPLWEIMGSDPGDVISQKRWLAFLEGGLLPIISLTSLHFFTKYDGGKKEKDVVKDEPVLSGPGQELTEEDYEVIKEEFLKKKLEEEAQLKYKPTKDDIEKIDNFLKSIGYEGPKPEEIKNEKYIPTETDLQKMESVLRQYDEVKNIPVELETEVIEEEPIVEEEIKEEDIEKVFFSPEEEVLYSDDSKIEVQEEQAEPQEEEIVVLNTPEPVQEAPKNKVLNYFKSSD